MVRRDKSLLRRSEACSIHYQFSLADMFMPALDPNQTAQIAWLLLDTRLGYAMRGLQGREEQFSA
jgi:hypothetical protein